ncbi:MAG: hypothetical protein V3V59_01045 [Thermodesulfovibrionales bacterium]
MKRTVPIEEIEYHVEYPAVAESTGKKNKGPVRCSDLSMLRGED